jgi:uncharacterized membrane protein YtjA (UPF0391 family)
LFSVSPAEVVRGGATQRAFGAAPLPPRASGQLLHGPMLNYSLILLFVGVVAGVVGFVFLTGIAATLVKLVSVVCLLLFIASFFNQKN